MAESVSSRHINNLISQLNALAIAPPQEEGLRQGLLDAARSLSHALETPGESVQRIVYAVLPEFLAETGYLNPVDATAGPFQKAYKTDLPIFGWMPKMPIYTSNFAKWVDASREGQNGFLDSFPFEEEVNCNLDPGTPLFVDVGGGIGHQCVALKSKLPHLPGRVILQDLDAFISQAMEGTGIEAMVHDFMTEQPVKGDLLF
ncbi:MAG: hypothetical protein Q9209_007252 [Squamulea sp. 1 TL-2023]